MDSETNQVIEGQKKQVFDEAVFADLHSACGIGHGIIRFSEAERVKVCEDSKRLNGNKMFFIPASGSGSRMFGFLYERLKTGKNTELTERFFKMLSNFAFYEGLDESQREKLGRISEEEIIHFLLEGDGLNLSAIPKGLIPFHKIDSGVLSPFQEHVLQSKLWEKNTSGIHFTIQADFQKEIEDSIAELNEQDIETSFSSQNPETDAYCFLENGQLAIINGEVLRRPAGHGALLENLNEVDADIVLIKNIDNVQHINRAEKSLETWDLLTGTLVGFQEQMIELLNDFSTEKFLAFNEMYQWVASDEAADMSIERLKSMASRPTRICGMVKNEGEPGGGPFWVKKRGRVSKEIVEKVQISDNEGQQSIMAESSHFNPVFIVAAKTDVFGNRLDVMPFRDEESYLVVNKEQNGTKIKYRELPGLWNGAMSNWNTLFVDIPSEVFSPVKNVMDLMKDAHKD